MIKKSLLLTVFVVLGLSLILAGCGGNKSSGTSNDKKSYEISYSTWANEGEPAYVGMQRFKKIVEDKTGGNVSVKLFPSNQIGTTEEQLEQVKMGTIQMMSSGNPGMKKLEYLALPYLMKSNDNWLKVLNSSVGEKWNKQLVDDKGIRNIGLLPRGPRIVSANKEIHTPEDMKGLKIRVPTRDYYVQTFEALGANPTPMDFGEVYSGLQTGVVDGQENPLETIYSAGFSEVQDYMIITHHMYKPAFVTINEEFYQNLPEDYRNIITDAAKQAQKYAEKDMEKKHAKMKKEMKEDGATFIEPDLEPFIQATQSVRDRLGKKVWGEDTYEKIKELGQANTED
ncbi:TRAP transporter substrate-binding protein [Tuberibacillus sp. Marseille-P3662]|uniref:TRAP transporter substrate-binding protein n=1 Tax=Tuberibacillus sp. Marseille-P3662 TaxID=1965358 RepID=UPI000A1C930B|nr:TRAP transporter substrate-binding protein [Tuberibacillus sp. Marseille-P3662]